MRNKRQENKRTIHQIYVVKDPDEETSMRRFVLLYSLEISILRIELHLTYASQLCNNIAMSEIKIYPKALPGLYIRRGMEE